MNFRRLAGTAIGAALLLTAGLQARAAPAVPDVEIIKAEFGIFEDDGSDQLGFGATSEIPFTHGQPYGWLIEVRTTRKSLAVREEVLMPQDTVAASGSNESDLAMPAMRESLLSLNERRVPVSDGMIFGERRIRAEDKAGRYRLRVYVERKLTATFDYSVLAPGSSASPEANSANGPPPRKTQPGGTKKAGRKM
jgi:hypothetical protein